MNHPMFAVLAIAAVALGCVAATEHPAPAFRHVVLLKFKDDAPAADVRKIEEEFRALKGKISQVQSLEWGTNISPEGLNQGFTHCFFVTFADEKARDAYLPHQAHQDFVKILRPALDKVLVVDYIAKD